MAKTILATIVRIRHIGFAEMWCKLQKKFYFVLMFSRAGIFQYGQIVLIHRQNVVKGIEVSLVELSGANKRQINTALLGGLLRSAVRLFANVIGVRSGRINLKAIRCAFIF